jgi:iron complex transport system ATP-binding protein
MNEPALLDFQNVSVMRGGHVVLHDINLRIGAGEHVAILGPNGSGKSTLIKTITREFYPLMRPGTTAQLFGRDTWNVFELRSLLGVVSNELGPDSRFCSGRDIVLSGFFSSAGIWKYYEITPQMDRRADELLSQLDAAHLADRPFGELSSGEARRLLIGRALVHSPKTLLLDEPSNSLDLFAQHELRETMRKLAASGIGLLLVTHQLADVIPEIDRVVLLKDGRVMADGSKSEILTQQTLEGLFGVQLNLHERDGYIHAW